MATETDLRLRSWLDGNQRERETMCRALLALDARYTEVRPRQPSGGPDGGRDVEAVLDGKLSAFGAVGFVNSANDDSGQKRAMRRKFETDLEAALAAKPDLDAFVFMTNVRFTVGEQDGMKRTAAKRGVTRCDVLDRERLRIELDSPAGFFIRFQHLSMPLSEAEQASFLSRYGDRIQEVVTTGFQRIDKTLARLLFLAEAADTLENLVFRFVLKRSHSADEIGHFRTFVFLALREDRPEAHLMWFGSTDGADRFRSDLPDPRRKAPAGTARGVGGGQWERWVSGDPGEEVPPEEDDGGQEDDERFYRQTSWSSTAGSEQVRVLFARYRHAGSDRGGWPRMSIRELDEAMFLPFVNAALADRIHSIQIYADGYRLDDLGPEDFQIDRSACGKDLPGGFSDEELADPWVRLRPSGVSSAHHFRFSERTPVRTHPHEEAPLSAPPPELR